MGENTGNRGRAMRVYQMALILAVGWFAGRLPALTAANTQEQSALAQAFGMGAATAAPAPARPADMAVVADVAARVAADVADQTIRRLLAAGWAPPSTSATARQTHAAGDTPTPERVQIVRIVAEQPARPAPFWSLPPAPSVAAAAPAATPAPVPVPAETAAARHAHALASSAYAALQAGDRRRASSLLAEALAAAPGAPQAGQWAADRQQLNRRWHVGGYVLSRTGGVQDPLAASPVLGGGQAGVAVGYAVDPLSPTRVSVIGRLTAAAGLNGAMDRETTEAALGLRVQPFAKLPLAVDVERRFALGLYSRNAWAARLSGGTAQDFRFGPRKVSVEAYGEAGAIGLRQTALYAGAQARAGTPLMTLGRVAVDGGAGLWTAIQHDYGQTVSRIDLGPSAQFRVKPWPFRAQVDYRVQASGNAQPGTGPVITVSGEF